MSRDAKRLWTNTPFDDGLELYVNLFSVRIFFILFIFVITLNSVRHVYKILLSPRTLPIYKFYIRCRRFIYNICFTLTRCVRHPHTGCSVIYHCALSLLLCVPTALTYIIVLACVCYMNVRRLYTVNAPYTSFYSRCPRPLYICLSTVYIQLP